MANQTSMTPTRKVGAAFLAGALTAISLELIDKFSGVTFSALFASSVTTVISFAVSYMVPNSDTDTPPAAGQE